MTKKKRFAVLGITAAVAVSAMSMGFASWKTEVSGNGAVTTGGDWDISVTNAALETSTGTTVSVTDHSFGRTGEMSDASIAAVMCVAGTAEQSGTQSNTAMSDYVNYYAVDTSKYSLEEIQSATAEEVNAIRSDSTTLDLDRYLNAYYRYYTSDTTESAAQATKVVDGFLADTTELLKSFAPDNYQNYVLIHFSAGNSGWDSMDHIFAEMKETVSAADEDDRAVINGYSVDFADVNFNIPDSWAAYTITVTNNGSVNASLSDAEIRLDTQDGDQLSLDAPELEGEILAPGESCTVKAVVKALDNGTGSLDASGSLVFNLPYAQEAVEEAPSSSHTHQ